MAEKSVYPQFYFSGLKQWMTFNLTFDPHYRKQEEWFLVGSSISDVRLFFLNKEKKEGKEDPIYLQYRSDTKLFQIEKNRVFYVLGDFSLNSLNIPLKYYPPNGPRIINIFEEAQKRGIKIAVFYPKP